VNSALRGEQESNVEKDGIITWILLYQRNHSHSRKRVSYSSYREDMAINGLKWLSIWMEGQITPLKIIFIAPSENLWEELTNSFQTHSFKWLQNESIRQLPVISLTSFSIESKLLTMNSIWFRREHSQNATLRLWKKKWNEVWR